MKKVAILQSNYIPWKGYFDLIGFVDEFVIYDDMQFTKRDWRNRNKIKTSLGPQWLTIPVQVKGKYSQKINETIILDSKWVSSHLKSLEFNYKKAPFFSEIFPRIEETYKEAANLEYLSDINYVFIKEINDILSIKTRIIDSRKFKIEGNKTNALLSVLKQMDGITTYLTGPAAKDYLDEMLINKEGINVEWMDYSDYKEYHQLYPPFVHEVSILDLLFNEGTDSRLFMKC